MILFKKAALYILIFFTLTLVGCSSKNSNTNVQEKEYDSIARKYFNKLSEKDKVEISKASPEDIINIYYKSINDKKYNLAVVCVSSFLNVVANESSEDINDVYKQYIDYLKNIKKIDIKSIEEFADGGKDTENKAAEKSSKVFYVNYTQKSNDIKKFPDLEGVFTKFITVAKSHLYDGWCISYIATSP